MTQERNPEAAIEAVKLLARNGNLDMCRRAAARDHAERYSWSATVQRMLNLHGTVAEGRVDRTIARTEDTR